MSKVLQKRTQRSHNLHLLTNPSLVLPSPYTSIESKATLKSQLANLTNHHIKTVLRSASCLLTHPLNMSSALHVRELLDYRPKLSLTHPRPYELILGSGEHANYLHELKKAIGREGTRTVRVGRKLYGSLDPEIMRGMSLVQSEVQLADKRYEWKRFLQTAKQRRRNRESYEQANILHGNRRRKREEEEAVKNMAAEENNKVDALVRTTAHSTVSGKVDGTFKESDMAETNES